MKCKLYNSKDVLLCKTDSVEEMNEFMINDGSDYNIVKIQSLYNNIRIKFESGLELFLFYEKNKM